MPNVIRFKRRASGAAGAPASLMETEPAYNAVDDTLYLGIGSGGAGGSATSIKPIGGSGAFVDKKGAQTISGNKTFTGVGFEPPKIIKIHILHIIPIQKNNCFTNCYSHIGKTKVSYPSAWINCCFNLV